MGLFDRFFSKESKEERFIKKHTARVLQKYGQKELRQESLFALANKGTPEAIYALLQRFTYTHPETIIDEKEKAIVIGLLEKLGPEVAGPPLRRYLEDPRQTEVSMALIALEELEGPEATAAEIIKILEETDPADVWATDRKLQLVNQLANYEDPKSIPVLLKFLQDANDDVVFRCIDVLDQIAEDDDIREPIVNLLRDEDTSARIVDRILELVLKRKWFLGPYRDEIEPHLPEGYFFDKRGNIKKSYK